MSRKSSDDPSILVLLALCSVLVSLTLSTHALARKRPVNTGGGFSALSALSALWTPEMVNAPLNVQQVGVFDNTTGLYFDSAPYKNPYGQTINTRVFAYYAAPGRKKAYPAIVLLHGYSDGASAKWVQKWVSQGYAAVSVDLSGNGPNWGDLDHPGAPDSRGGPAMDFNPRTTFDLTNNAPTNVQPYFAVAAAMRAVTFLLTHKEVDPKRISVMGISWGGISAATVAAIDTRICAGVVTYACGYLAQGWSGKSAISDPRWTTWFDPESYVPKTHTPILWMRTAGDDPAFTTYWVDKTADSMAPGLGVKLALPGFVHSKDYVWGPQDMATAPTVKFLSDKKLK